MSCRSACGPHLVLVALMTNTSSDAQVLHGQGHLHLDNAIYGKDGKGMNVANRLRSMVQNNVLDLKVSNNNLGGDPNVGADTTLKNSYTNMVQHRVATFKERERCRLP